MIDALAAWLFAATWKGSLLLALALAIHALGRNRVAARWLYALLFVAMLRLLVPVAPSSRLSVFNLIPSTAEAPPPPAFAGLKPGLHAAAVGRASARPIFVRNRREPSPGVIILLALWAAGAQFALARQLLRSLALRRALKRAIDVTSPVLDDCRELLRVRRAVRLRITDAVDAPALHGWLRPAILLPSLLEPEALRHVLLHELAHLKRRDVLANWVVTIARALHWFNPLVHLAAARLGEERELACDALALAQLRGAERSAYGGTVLQLLDQLRAPAPVLVGMTTTKRQVKRRILMIARFQQRRSSSILFALFLCATAFVTLTDATAGEPKERHLLMKQPLTPAARAVMERLDQNVTLTLDSVSVEDVVRLVANGAGANVTIPDGVLDDAARAAKVSIKAENVPAHVVLLETLAAFELAVEFDDTGVQVIKAGPMRLRTAYAPGTPAEQKARDEVFFTQRIARDHAARVAVQAESDEANGGGIHRTVKFRGEGEQPEGTFELTVRKAN